MIIDCVIPESGNCPEVLFLGRTGENDFRTVRFDVSRWAGDFAGATFQLVYQRPDGQMYPVSGTACGEFVFWTVSETDLAVPGTGVVELRLSSGSVQGRTAAIGCEIQSSLSGQCAPPPDPEPSWIREVLDAADKAEAAADSIRSLTVSAKEVSPGAPAAAEYDPGTGKMVISVPKGEKGEPGVKGDRGEKGEQGDKGDSGEGIEDLTSLNIPHVEWGEILYDTDSGIRMTGKAKLATADMSSTPDVEVDIPMKAGDNMSMDVSEDGKHIIIKPELTNYVKFDDVATANKTGVLMSNRNGGLEIRSTGLPWIYAANKGNIDGKKTPYNPIVPLHLDYAIRAGLISNSEITADDSYDICKTIGAVHDGKWELIDSYTTAAGEASVERDTEPDGVSYNFNSLAAVVTVPKDKTISFQYFCRIHAGTTKYSTYIPAAGSDKYYKKAIWIADVSNKNYSMIASTAAGFSYDPTPGTYSSVEPTPMKKLPIIVSCESAIQKIEVYTTSATGLPTGTLIQIYGIRR